MIYHDYTLTTVTRRLPTGHQANCIQIEGNGRRTWAETVEIAKRAIDGWERSSGRKEARNSA